LSSVIAVVTFVVVVVVAFVVDDLVVDVDVDVVYGIIEFSQIASLHREFHSVDVVIDPLAIVDVRRASGHYRGWTDDDASTLYSSRRRYRVHDRDFDAPRFAVSEAHVHAYENTDAQDI